MIENHIQILNTNPFFSGKILQSFYSGYGKSTCSILLHYLVLPMVLFSETRMPLSEINIRTDLTRFTKLNKIQLLELQNRITQFKNLTNLSLIYLHNHKKIEIDSNVKIIESISYEEYSDDIKTYYRASHYLGLLFSNEEVPNVFKTLNIIL